MTNEEKGRIYSQLMFEHTKIQNKIASIKGESIELNPQQLQDIKKLENQLLQIFKASQKLY